MPSLSVAIITLNEEKNLDRCLASLGSIADEIVIVDSGSTDGTERIARAYGARFLHHTFENYVHQKNYALSQCANDHVLSLDADEALSGELRDSIQRALIDWNTDAYSMSRLTNYCGAWIRHGGWYPDRKVRLFRRSQGAWTGVHVHEAFTLNNRSVPVGTVRGDLLHYSFSSISDHLRRIDHYTEMTAAELVAAGRSAPLWKIVISPPARFIRDYLFRGGYLDGFYGFVVAMLSSYAVFIKYAKSRHVMRRRDTP